MTFPIRCFTCNKCIGQYEEKYNNMVENGIPKNEIFKSLNLYRYCCRRMFLGHKNVNDQVLLFPKHINYDYEQKKEDNL
jgi:DNA-directed RNA polymerase subunit N (RpoN/RPB10)